MNEIIQIGDTAISVSPGTALVLVIFMIALCTKLFND